MNIVIKATGCELPETMRVFIEGKLGALRKFTRNDMVPSLLACEIEESMGVVRAGARYRADGTLTVEGRIFRAEALGGTLEEAVDRLRDELSQELRRAGGRGRDLLRRGGARIKRMLRGGI